MTSEQATELIRGGALSRHAGLLLEHLMPSARIIVHDGSIGGSGGLTASHFGGSPSVPARVTWPVWDRREFLMAQIEWLDNRFKANPRATGWRDVADRARQELSRGLVPLAFLGQLCLSEIHAVAPLPGWPREGTLAFFYDPTQGAWGFDPRARGHCRVMFFSAHEELAPVRAPDDLPDEARFPERKLSFRLEWTLPRSIEAGEVSLSSWDNEEYDDLCRQLMPASSDDEPIHRCGGYPQEIQGDMRLECQLVSNGIYCGDESGYRDPRRSLLEKGAADWRLLLQIDSDEKRCGWMWGDVGRVYFWARRQDIEAADFDSAWAILQCY